LARAAPTTRGSEPARVLLEGRPGVGKTTVAVRLAELLRDEGIQLGGFVTEELRESGRRVGFAVETFAGERATLAHVRLPGPPRVGRYGVDLEAFERVALPALSKTEEAALVLIDELGKMELASDAFRAAVSNAFTSERPIVATVHIARHPFTDELKRRDSVEVLRVARRNRDGLPDQVLERLGASFRGQTP
jgi:nucleoside-triphosphatase